MAPRHKNQQSAEEPPPTSARPRRAPPARDTGDYNESRLPPMSSTRPRVQRAGSTSDLAPPASSSDPQAPTDRRDGPVMISDDEVEAPPRTRATATRHRVEYEEDQQAKSQRQPRARERNASGQDHTVPDAPATLQRSTTASTLRSGSSQDDPRVLGEAKLMISSSQVQADLIPSDLLGTTQGSTQPDAQPRAPIPSDLLGNSQLESQYPTHNHAASPLAGGDYPSDPLIYASQSTVRKYPSDPLQPQSQSAQIQTQSSQSQARRNTHRRGDNQRKRRSDALSDLQSDVQSDMQPDGDDAPRKRKYRKRNPPPNTEVLQGEVLPARARLEEVVRWHFFRWFTATDKSHQLIRKVWPDLDPKSHEYTLACQDISSWSRNWKSRTLERLQEHIVRAVEISTVNLEHIDKPKALFHHFFDNFSFEDFFRVFYWIADLLDWERTSKTGKNFVRNIWANLATQMKLHNDIDPDEYPAESEGDWKQIVAFWDTMGRDPNYKNVKLTEFKQLPPKMKVVTKRRRNYPVRETFAVGLDEEVEDSEHAEYDEGEGDEDQIWLDDLDDIEDKRGAGQERQNTQPADKTRAGTGRR